MQILLENVTFGVGVRYIRGSEEIWVVDLVVRVETLWYRSVGEGAKAAMSSENWFASRKKTCAIAMLEKDEESMAGKDVGEMWVPGTV